MINAGNSLTLPPERWCKWMNIRNGGTWSKLLDFENDENDENDENNGTLRNIHLSHLSHLSQPHSISKTGDIS
jgi:hypothetical protein